MKSDKNRTIDISVYEGQEFLDNCIRVEEDVTLEKVLDKTIVGDTFEVMKHLPKKSVDLLIVDPPYNMDKDFHGNVFKKTSTNNYINYTKEWIEAVIPLLKDNASIYVCCDWESGMQIGPVLGEYFHIQNRITWQREKGRGALSNWKNGMEDIWFATKSKKYTFNVEDVKVRRRVVAPYKIDGKPKDWEETQKKGNFVLLSLQIFGMIFQFLTGLCLKIPHIRHRNQRNF